MFSSTGMGRCWTPTRPSGCRDGPFGCSRISTRKWSRASSGSRARTASTSAPARFDADGRMFFLVDRQGRPPRKRCHIFSEAFMIAAGQRRPRGETQLRSGKLSSLYQRATSPRHARRPPAQVGCADLPDARPGGPDIAIVTARLCAGPWDLSCRMQSGMPAAMPRRLLHRRDSALSHAPCSRPCWRLSGSNGEFLDHFDGRTLNPGHAIERPGSSCKRRMSGAMTRSCCRWA